MKKILIINEDSLGLHEDAQIISGLMMKVYKDIRIYKIIVPKIYGLDFSDKLQIPDEVNREDSFDIVFFLEHIYFDKSLLNRYKFKHMVFVPNIEWLIDSDEYLICQMSIDTIIVKNAFSMDRLNDALSSRSRNKLSLTGWSSHYFAEKKRDHTKDFRKFLHIAGASDQKGSDEICDAWLSQSGMPHLTICYSGNNLKSAHLLKNKENVSVVNGEMTRDQVARLQSMCGIHIYPSRMEGFGHALNQCRASGSVLLTTGGYPMMSLVDDGKSGFLMEATAAPLRRTLSYTVDANEIIRRVKYVSSIPPERLCQIGQMAQSQFVIEKVDFEKKFINLFS